MKRIVLDASAMIALYEEEPGAAKVSELIHLANDQKLQLLMCVVNWGEMYYNIWRGRGPGVARKVLEGFAQLPITLVDADYDLTRRAAELKAEHKLPYADCFAAALASHRNASLATSDRDFEKIEKQVSILWIAEN